MVKNNGKPTSERISDEIYSTPLVQPQKITKVTKKSAKPTKKSVSNFLIYIFLLFIIFFMFYRHEFMNYRTKCTRHQPESKIIFMNWQLFKNTSNKRSNNSSTFVVIFITWVTILFVQLDDFGHVKSFVDGRKLFFDLPSLWKSGKILDCIFQLSKK